MPRSKQQDAARKRAAYANNETYRERHKAQMRVYYHMKKAELAALRDRIRLDELASTATDTTMSDATDATDATMVSAESEP